MKMLDSKIKTGTPGTAGNSALINLNGDFEGSGVNLIANSNDLRRTCGLIQGLAPANGGFGGGVNNDDQCSDRQHRQCPKVPFLKLITWSCEYLHGND